MQLIAANLNLNKHELKNFKIQESPDFVGLGTIYFGTSLKVYTGTEFTTVSTSGVNIGQLSLAINDLNINSYTIKNLAAGTINTNDAARLADLELLSTGGLENGINGRKIKLVNDSLSLSSNGLKVDLVSNGSSLFASKSDHNHNDTYLLLNGGTLTDNLSLAVQPTLNNHIATKQYADELVGKLLIKQSVRVATTTNITLSGIQTIDDVLLIINDRILVKDQLDNKQNGIYLVNSSNWIRSPDTDGSYGGEVTNNLYTFVGEGTINSSTSWVLTTLDPIVLGTSNLIFNQFSYPEILIPSTGLVKNNNNILSRETIGGLTAGSYNKITIDSYGRVILATNQTTIPNDASGVLTQLNSFRSGLDADLLNNRDSSYYATKEYADSKVNHPIINRLKTAYYSAPNATSTAYLTNFGLNLSALDKWCGSVLGLDGKIYCSPYDSANVLIIDPATETASLTNFGLNLSGSDKWRHGCLGSDGKIYFAPFDSNYILIINPSTQTAELKDYGLTLTGGNKYIGCICTNNKIYFIRASTSTVLIIDIINQTASLTNFGLNLGENFAYQLAPNGKIYCLSAINSLLLIINPFDDTAIQINFNLTTGSHYGTSLGCDGKIYFTPRSATECLIIDPITNTISQTNFGLTLESTDKWEKSVVGSDGKIYCLSGLSDDFLIVDPITQTAIRTNFGLDLSGQSSYNFCDGRLALNGKIYCPPRSFNKCLVIQPNAAPLEKYVTLSPYLNK